MNQTWAAFSRWQKLGLLLPVLLLVEALALGLGINGTARAESFSDPAFQQQWSQTDQAVANGTASRTYFWGPQAFAHTKEVYAESPDNGQREVQYFDKARMELTKKSDQPASQVTNGLLTVELVTGQMQVGDNQFLKRSAAQNPVAGDQVGNTLTPTYATFGFTKLAFGVPGAVKAANRTGQTVNEAITVNGNVSTPGQLPVSLKYARYFDETGHNVADVFNNFFQQSPLGEDKWLSVMGYPITEAYWAKDQVVVGGQKKDVLIQLFQRRALTYTPGNPAGFQVEMGNIGQHYYVWRYGFDTRDQLPGNYRLIYPQGTSLYSVNIRKPADKVKLGDAPATITGAWPLNEGRAVVTTEARKTYLVDLTKARAFKELTLPTGDGLDPATIAVYGATSSSDGQKVAVTFGSGSNIVVQAYIASKLPGDNLNVTSSFKVFTFQSSSPAPVTFSPGGMFLAATFGDRLHTFDFVGGYNKSYDVKGTVYWANATSLLVTTPSISEYDGSSGTYKTVSNGKVYLVDTFFEKVQQLTEGPNIRAAVPSPDGHYFALLQDKGGKQSSGSALYYPSLLTFRSLTDPGKDLTPAYEQGSAGRDSTEPYIVGWNADGTFVQVQSYAPGTAGVNTTGISFVSLVNGKDLKKAQVQGYYLSNNVQKLAASLYLLIIQHTYNGPDKPADDSIKVINFDNSDETVLFTGQQSLNGALNNTLILSASVVQVPVI